jgi:hypothetical protein
MVTANNDATSMSSKFVDGDIGFGDISHRYAIGGDIRRSLGQGEPIRALRS